ncbi:hypothetical protein ACH4PU_33115 [Streptomyces sp. NPDC021100]|uniref:hypothetical protein n=1 Tax=Streptomyces sp. NPDC021100 TaxID=3365114 RepID=UPI0037A23C3E
MGIGDWGIWQSPAGGALGCASVAVLTVGPLVAVAALTISHYETPQEQDTALTADSSLIGLCELPPKYFPKTTGRPAVDPTSVWLYHSQNGGNPGRDRIDMSSRPDGPRLGWKQRDARRVRFVGCTGVDKDSHYDTGLTCSYGGRTVPLRSGPYLLDLRAVRDGHLVASGKITPARPHCPTEDAFHAYGAPDEAYATPTPEEYQTVFERLAKGGD